MIEAFRGLCPAWPQLGRAAAGLIIVLALNACGPVASNAPAQVQRATRGPTAEDVFLARFARSHGRAPTFDEQIAWKEQTEAHILSYLSRHPELSASPLASQIRFHRMVIVGMRKGDVLALLGQPEAKTENTEDMRLAAGQFWTLISAHAEEMWMYPLAWALYFQRDVLVDVTVGEARGLR